MKRDGKLGQEAKEAVFECPFLLTKNAKNMRESLPALINVLGCPADSFLGCGKYWVLKAFSGSRWQF